jgi:hypothetical protein
VLYHGLVRELNKRLGVCERLRWVLVVHGAREHRGAFEPAVSEEEAYERAQTGSKPSDENDGCIFC